MIKELAHKGFFFYFCANKTLYYMKLIISLKEGNYMEKTLDFESFKKGLEREQRKREKKEKIKNAYNKSVLWIRSNADILAMTIPAGIAVVGGVSKVASKAISNHKLNKEIEFKDTTIYDHSLGRYVRLKHKLTSKESLEIEKRRSNGEKLHTILNDMKLLK